MRENRTSGSVRGALGNRRSYRESVRAGIMKRIDRYIERLYLHKFSCTNDGMHLEICIRDSADELATNEWPYPIATIRADKGDNRRFVFFTESGPISVPLEEIEKVIMIAKEEVHSEDYYD